MRIPGIRRLWQVARGVRDRFSSEVLVLLYHRVRTAPCFDPYVLGVTPQHFAEHLEIIPKYGRPMRLQQLVRALQHGKLPCRAVIITFDDGYADNLHHAKPLLERYDFPATVFVTSGYVGQVREFWWDELERMFLQPGTLPAVLHLDIGGVGYRWELGDATSYGQDEYERHHTWHYGNNNERIRRHGIFRSIYQKLSPLPESKRRQALEALGSQTNSDPVARPTHRVMSPAEVVRLAEGTLVEIGVHTVTHPVLASLSGVGQRDEIRGTKAQLEEILGKPVTSFAYPYGSRARSNYTTETVAVVRDAGFTCACSNLAQPVRRGADSFQLPRAGIRDWDGDELARRLEVWFHA